MAHGPTATETRHLRTLFSLGAAGMLTDGQLLERFAIRDGEPAELAFAALVERHGPMVLRVARSVIGDEPSAHDTFQATFLILARKAQSLWVRDSLGPWLHAVAFRVASQSRSAEARRKRHERSAAGPEAYQPREPDRSDLLRAIHQEIDRLPNPYRLAVVTCHLEGLTQQDAAHRLGWPLGTLQSRLARGRHRLRKRLQNRGFAPSIGIIAAKLHPIPPILITSTAKLAATLQLSGPIAGMIAPTVLVMIETTTKGMLMTKLKLGAVALVILGGIVSSGIGLSLGRPVRTTEEPTSLDQNPSPKDTTKSDPAKPELTTLSITQPWETVVRIRLSTDGKPSGQHSGTIIQSMPDESIILTTAHDFDSVKFVKGTPQSTILVDLFDGKLTDQPPLMVHESERGLAAEFVDIDREHDLALIRIRAGRRLPASPIIPPSWPFKKKMKMVALGCSPGQDPRVWHPTLLEFGVVRKQALLGTSSWAIKCDHRPGAGRSGGGLFTIEGYLAGVCASDDPTEDAGLYVAPGVIHRLLDRNRMTTLYFPGYQASPDSPKLPILPTALPPEATAPIAETPDSVLPRPLDRFKAPKVTSPDDEPGLVIEQNPKPWETVVRIKLHLSASEWGFGSGTIIASTAEESIILTCAHTFRIKGPQQPSPKDFRIPISVDLFGSQFVNRQPAMLRCTEKDLPGEVIDYDFTNDVGLIRIRPGRTLAASKVVPPNWHPQQGMKMITVGCSHGQDATAWDTMILDPKVAMTNSSTKQSFVMIKCAYQPKEGRAGGGLFTSDGSIAGVCDFADPNEHVGLYATPESIRQLLDRNGLSPVASRQKIDDSAPVAETPIFVAEPAKVNEEAVVINSEPILNIEPVPTVTVSDQDRRLKNLERKLDQVLKALDALKPDSRKGGLLGP